MKGTVAPLSSRSMAAWTCHSCPFNSPAICCEIDAIAGPRWGGVSSQRPSPGQTHEGRLGPLGCCCDVQASVTALVVSIPREPILPPGSCFCPQSARPHHLQALAHDAGSALERGFENLQASEYLPWVTDGVHRRSLKHTVL